MSVENIEGNCRVVKFYSEAQSCIEKSIKKIFLILGAKISQQN